MNLSVQLTTMIMMGVMGIWIGLAVDTYGRFFYRGGNRWRPVQIAGDLLFWFVQGLLVFFVLLQVNDGDLRIYIFLALFCGYAAYKSLLQSLYRRLLESVIRMACGTYRVLRRAVVLFIIRPLQFVLKLVYTIGKWLLLLLMLAVTIVWAPLKWIIPKAVIRRVEKFFSAEAGIGRYVKNILKRVQSWLKRKDEEDK